MDKLKNVVWKEAFFKTYKEKRSWWLLVTNFNRIRVTHLDSFWFYTAYNAPTIYTKRYEQQADNKPHGAYY